jgi:hypothetical protein
MTNILKDNSPHGAINGMKKKMGVIGSSVGKWMCLSHA